MAVWFRAWLSSDIILFYIEVITYPFLNLDVALANFCTYNVYLLIPVLHTTIWYVFSFNIRYVPHIIPTHKRA